MTLAQIDKTKTAWPTVAETLHVPHSPEDYQELVALLDSLVDEVGEDESHPLASLSLLHSRFGGLAARRACPPKLMQRR